MSNLSRKPFVVAMALLILLGASPACRSNGESPVPTEEVTDVLIEEDPEPVENIEIAAESMSAETEQQSTRADVKKSDPPAMKWKKIKPVEVPRGGGVRFIVKGGAAWITIPDGQIKRSSGGRDWAKGQSFITFRVEEGEAVVMVPRDYSSPTKTSEIHYSVLARNGGGRWEYVHGENPPPRIVIR